MPKWEDSRITNVVKDELADLDSVLGIVAQLPRPVALRLLEYCLRYVRDGSTGSPPMLESEAMESILSALKGKGGGTVPPATAAASA